jgi:DNA-binding NarL/FixJ family response regulator
MSPPAELILIVDDHPLMLEAIHLSVRPLFENPEFEFAGTLSEALVGVARRAPRLILLDLSLPDAGGLDGVFRMRAARPQSTLIVVSARDDQITVALTRALGVDGFISKSQSAIDIRRHVRSVLDGEIVFPSLADAGAAIGGGHGEAQQTDCVRARCLGIDSEVTPVHDFQKDRGGEPNEGVLTFLSLEMMQY